MRGLSTSMARALKSARRPRKIRVKQTWPLSFEIFPQKTLLTFMRGDNVTPVTSHYQSP